MTTTVSRMGGDADSQHPPTEESEAATPAQWFIIAHDGASSFPLTSGLIVGETETGELVFDDPDPDAGLRWVEFVLTDDGEPWLMVRTRDKALKVADVPCVRHALEEGTAVQLPNNTLYVSRDLNTPRPSGTVIEVVHRNVPRSMRSFMLPERAPASGKQEEPDDAEPPPQQRPATPTPRVTNPPPQTAAEPAPEPFGRVTPAPAQEDLSESVAATYGFYQREYPKADDWRRRVTVLAVVLAVAAGTVAGVVTVLVTGNGGPTIVTDLDPSPVDAPPITPLETPPAPRVADETFGEDAAAGDATPLDLAEIEPIDQPGSPSPDPETAATASAAPPDDLEVADAGPQTTAGATAGQTPEPEPAPVAAPTGAQSSAQERVEGVAVAQPAPSPVAQPAPAAAPPARKPAPAAPDPALVAAAALRRDLLAADLALSEGRLVAPANDNALTLYSRVLAADPESPEARAGLQSVRQQLINRVMAQLAGGSLDDARAALRSAEAAGASPALVSDLGNEIEYRQRLIDQRAN